jgi:hypothetical protein
MPRCFRLAASPRARHARFFRRLAERVFDVDDLVARTRWAIS